MPVILVVDDEAVVLQIARLALERSGRSMVTARSAAEAFAAVEKLARVDVLIVDHSLSPDRGRDVAERLLLKYPEMKIMHVSG
jgi:CheY-like chemotaxis protein